MKRAIGWGPIATVVHSNLAGSRLRRKCVCDATHPAWHECPSCREARKKKLQRHSNGLPGHVVGVPSVVHQVLGSSGRSLEPATRDFMARRFGHDFSTVRIHDDHQASESARAVRAEAYTVGQDIVFDAGRYSPTNRTGLELLAHELAHTLQQGVQQGGAPLTIVPENDPSEREADVISRTAMRGSGPEAVSRSPSRSAFAVARKQTPWPAWHQNALAAISRIAGPSDGKTADPKWPALREYLCGLSAEHARSLYDRLGPEAAGLKGGTDDFAVYVRNKFPLNHERLTAVLRALADGKVPSDCVQGESKNKKRKKKRPKEKEPEEKEPPVGQNVLEDCTSSQEHSIRDAVSRALQDLDAAIALLAAKPLSEHARNAMFIVYRTEDDKAADSVVGRLRQIRTGLPNVEIACDQPGEWFSQCGKGTAAFTNILTNVIHLCMGSWDEANAARAHPRTLIHEGAHAFTGASALESYFDDHCEDQDETAGLDATSRLPLADGLACVVYHLTHRTAEEVAGGKALYSGEALTQIVQYKKGPISLGGAPSKPYFFPYKVPQVTATNFREGGGFAYRWRLFDDSARRYLLRGVENDEPLDWREFTDQREVIIGRKTRDLLGQRSVTKGVIECTVRIPGKDNKTVRLDLEFTP